MAYADYDQDGDLDLVTGNWNGGYRLYQNQGNGNRWLSLDLRGGEPTVALEPEEEEEEAVIPPVNRDAVGARVYVTADGVEQLQTVTLGSGLGGNNQLALHFGLGAALSAELRILWSNGVECSFAAVPANQRLRLVYGLTAGCG